MTLTPQEREVLELAAEDYFGLWEIAWRLNNVFEAGDEPPTQVAARVVGTLCSRGLAKLFLRDADDHTPIVLDGRSIDLTMSRFWDEPKPGDAQILIAATQLGRKVLRGQSEVT